MTFEERINKMRAENLKQYQLHVSLDIRRRMKNSLQTHNSAHRTLIVLEDCHIYHINTSVTVNINNTQYKFIAFTYHKTLQKLIKVHSSVDRLTHKHVHFPLSSDLITPGEQPTSPNTHLCTPSDIVELN
jgi:hypothetical protein